MLPFVKVWGVVRPGGNYIFTQRSATVSSEHLPCESYSELSLNLHHMTKSFSRSFLFILILGRNYFQYLEKETKFRTGE